MDKKNLRAFALDEKERRLRVHRDYELPADGPIMPMVTVSAAVLADSPFTADLHRRAKESTDKDEMFPWIAPGRPNVPLTAAQIRSLTEQVEVHEVSLHDFFHRLLRSIDIGAISTPEKIQNADWPA